jgi:hypothetical protein
LTACARRHEHNLDRIVGARERGRLLQLLRKLHTELG